MRVWIVLLFLGGTVANLVASSYALGVQKETWSDVDLEGSTNPGNPASKEIGFGHLKFTLADITTWYLEEPGVIFGVLSGMAETEANEAAARAKARREGSLTYSWDYGRPAPIPEGQWNRWSYSSAKAKGVTFVSSSGASSFDSEVILDYQRLNMDIVTGPEPWGDWGVYWMPSSEISLRSLKFYKAPAKSSTDFSTIAVPFSFHVGYQPKLFPWLTVEARAGWDFVSWGLFALASLDSKKGLQNYTQGVAYGVKASLGVDWVQLYFDASHRVEPLWNLSGYARRYEGNLTAVGVRFDVGNLIAQFLTED